MRPAIFAAPLVAAAYAAKTTTSTDKGYTLVSEISGSVTVISTYYYSNPATKYLTQTNSVGVITGMPSQETSMPHAVTTQPRVATIPAGLSKGMYTIVYNATAGLTSFTVDVESSSTTVLGGTNVGTTSGSVFIPAGQTGTKGPGHHTAGGATGTNNQGTKTGSAAASSTSPGAGSNVKAASAGMLGLGALFAALL